MFNSTPSADNVCHAIDMASELLSRATVENDGTAKARVSAILGLATRQLPPGETTDDDDPDQRAHSASMLLQHAARICGTLRFADWSVGETVGALCTAAAREAELLLRALERSAAETLDTRGRS